MSRNQRETIENLFQNANRLMSEQRPIEARQHLEKAVKLNPNQARIWHLLADTHLVKNDVERGISSLELALTQSGFSIEERVSLQVHLASTYIKTGDLGSASQSIDVDTARKLKNPMLAARVGYLLAICEEHAAALTTFETALELDPSNPELLFNAAAAHRSMGNLETAEYLYDQVLSLAPDSYPAYWLRSSLRRQTADSNHTRKLKELAENNNIPTEGKIHLLFSLAKELEDLTQYKDSFSALEKGAALKKKSIGYNVSSDIRAIEKIQHTYNQSAVKERRNTENTNGENVIFILGMPRTGSTLVDRILSTHANVDSVGEPDTFAQIFYRSSMQAAHVNRLNNTEQLKAIQHSINLDFKKIGKAYQEKLSLRARQKNSLYIIDKNPSNFLYLGAIRLALPRAKIIHIKRNPMDSCYAIFKTLFKNGHPYSYDQTDLARYYSAYINLMDHWNSVFENEYFELIYENLTNKPEETSRELMAYCGLNWSEECLTFYENRRKGTATASAAQVRQPIYSSSIGLWKNYEKELSPLRKALSGKL